MKALLCAAVKLAQDAQYSHKDIIALLRETAKHLESHTFFTWRSK